MNLFKSQPFFNTNNIWVNITDLISVIESNALSLDLILNKKSTSNYSFVQLEYAMGSAIQSFSNAQVMIVPRHRFFPVKRTTDLLLLLSDYVEFSESGIPIWDSQHVIDIQLHPPFDSVDGFLNCFSVIPSIKSLDALELKGNVYFNHHVRLKNTVKILLDANDDLHLDDTIKELTNVDYIDGHFSAL